MANEFRVGDEVLAPWMDDGFYYPAIIVDIAGSTAHVAYFDGAEKDVQISGIRQGVLGPGLTVSVNWKGQGTYYNGIVQKRIGAALFFHYEDGEKGWTTVSQCRVRGETLQTINPELSACTYCGAAIDSGSPTCQHCGMSRQWR